MIVCVYIFQAAPRLNQANGEAAVGDQLTWHNEICRILNVAAGQRLSEEELFEHAKRELGICLRKGVTPAELDSIFTSVPEDGSAEPTLSLR